MYNKVVELADLSCSFNLMATPNKPLELGNLNMV